MHFTIQPVSTGGVQAGHDQGGSILGLEKVPQCCKLLFFGILGEITAVTHRFLGWVFTAEWLELAEEDLAIHIAVSTITKRTQQLAVERGLLLDFVLSSFAGKGQNVMGSYGAHNVERLKATAAKYDPERGFQRLQNDGFLLRDV